MFKKVISVFLAMLMVTSVFAVFPPQLANAAVTTGTIGNYTYTTDGDIVTITKVLTSIAGDVVIPSILPIDGTGKPVKIIGSYAFYNCSSLTSVTIPNSVTTIGYSAFYNCSSLTTITIPNGVTSIGNEAFYKCSSLTSVTIPNSVTTIGYSAFYNCSSLTTITIPNSVTTIDSLAFENCSSLTSITIPNSVTTIGGYAFQSCRSLTSVTIPNSVTLIGGRAFSYCSSLTSITIPSSVTLIGGEAFSYCSSLTSITIPNSVTTIGIDVFKYTPNVVINCIAGSTAHTYAVANSIDFIATILDANTLRVTPPANGAIPANATTTANYYDVATTWKSGSTTHTGAFVSGNSYTIEMVLTPKAKYKFTADTTSPVGYTKSLNASGVLTLTKTLVATAPKTTITSATITGIVDPVLDAAQSTAVSGDTTKYTVATTWLKGNTAMTSGEKFVVSTVYKASIVLTATAGYDFKDTTTVPAGYEKLISIDGATLTLTKEFYEIAPDSLFTYTTNGDAVTITECNAAATGKIAIPSKLPNTAAGKPVTVIGNEAFKDCTSITKVIIPNSVTTIGEYAFDSCSSLTSITIPNSVTTIGKYAFNDCRSLTSIIIPNSVTTIGDGAFWNCSSLTSVTIPNSVTTIGEYAFRSCSSLTTITIPNSVTSIGVAVFFNCSSLTSVTIPNSVTTIGEYAFYNCSSLTTITIPNGVTTIGEGAFLDCRSLASITIPNSVTLIGGRAFSECRSLTSITIPSSVTLIGGEAFSYCSSLTSITIPNSVTTIGIDVFKYTPNVVINCIAGSTAHTYAVANSIDFIATISDMNTLRVTPPANGVIPANATTTSNYYDVVTTWKSGSTTHTGAFVSGTSYTIEMVLTPKTKYKFTADTTVPTGYTKTLNNNGTLLLTKTFVVTAPKTTITSATITGIIDPVLDAAQSTAVSGDPTKYTATTTWLKGNTAMTSGEKFVVSTVYKASIVLTATAGYDFKDSTTVPAGYEKSISIEGTTLTLTKEFYEVALEAPDNLFTYTTNGDAVTITKCNATATGKIAIPSKLPNTAAGKPVTVIGDNAFRDCTSITKVIIPNGITTIGANAFRGCTVLTSITIPNGVTSIGSGVFYDCSSLTSITIPNSATSIGNYAFNGCSSLASVTIPNGVTTIGEGAFDSCSSLTSVTIPNSVTTIGNSAFQYCSSLTTITIPNGVTTIGEGAFLDCRSLASITIPNSVTSIGDNAFRSCTGLTTITIPNSVTSIGVDAFYNCRSLTTITIPSSVTLIGGKAFSYCSSLTSITILNGVTFIGDSAFENCRSLTSITIPSSVKVIGTNAFLNTPNVVINCITGSTANTYAVTNSIKFIATILDANTLRVTPPINGAIPASATTTSNYYDVATTWKSGSTTHTGAFVAGNNYTIEMVLTPKAKYKFTADIASPAGYTKSLNASGVLTLTKTFVATAPKTTITSATITGIVDPVLDAAQSTAVSGDTTKYTATTTWLKGNTAMTTGEKFVDSTVYKASIVLTAAAGYNFKDSTTVPTGYEKLVSIDGATLTLTKEFYEVALEAPDSLFTYTTNGDAVTITKCNATATGKIAIPSKLPNTAVGKPVTVIGNEAFKDCTSITKVIIPNGVTTIGDAAFWNCSSLTSITIPNSVISIGNLAFDSCRSLTSITIPNGITSIGYGAFSECRSLTSITIPNSVTSIDVNAFYNCGSLISITIPNSVTSIGNSAFRNCTALTSITIPNSVTTISIYAFTGTPNVVINCIAGSTANTYAVANSIKFIATILDANTLSVTTPVNGVIPANTTTTSNYYDVVTTWKRGSAPHTVAFVSGTSYIIEMVLTPKAKHQFTEDITSPAGYTMTLNNNGTLTLTKTFVATAPKTTITSATVTGIADPVKDAAQSTAVSGDTTKYTATTTWLKGNTAMTSGEKFVASTVYNVRIVLTATAGNKFAGSTTIPAGYAKVVSIDGTALTLTKIFPIAKYITMDMNGDKTVDIEDALLALKAELGIITKDLSADNSTAEGILNKSID